MSNPQFNVLISKQLQVVRKYFERTQAVADLLFSFLNPDIAYTRIKYLLLIKFRAKATFL